VRFLAFGVVIGLLLGSVAAATGQRLYLFNGHELLSLYGSGESARGNAYIAGVVDSMTWTAYGGSDAVPLFTRAAKCLREGQNPSTVALRASLERRDFVAVGVSGASPPSGLTPGWQFGAPAPRAVAYNVVQTCSR